MKRVFVRLSVALCAFILILACTPEKKPDYATEINEKGKIAAQADVQLAANKFDEAAATYQKTLTELDMLKQKIPAGDPALPSLETLISATKGKLSAIPAAKQEYEAKIAAEAKKAEAPPVKSEGKPAATPKAKVKAKAEPQTKEQTQAKPEAKTEVKSMPQTKAETAVVEPKKKEPVKWKVVYRGKLASGETEWHILCGDSLARVIKQDPTKKEKAYLAGYGGKSYDKLDEAAVAVCSQ